MDLICERVELWRKGENPYVIEEFEHSLFVVGDHQFYRGYSLILLKEHVRELHELSPEVYRGLMDELYRASQAVFKTFKPWKMNQQCLGNKDQHVHWHILPRYEDDPYHGTLPFTDYMKGEISLSDYMISHEEAQKLAQEIRTNL